MLLFGQFLPLGILDAFQFVFILDFKNLLDSKFLFFEAIGTFLKFLVSKFGLFEELGSLLLAWVFLHVLEVLLLELFQLVDNKLLVF